MMTEQHLKILLDEPFFSVLGQKGAFSFQHLGMAEPPEEEPTQPPFGDPRGTPKSDLAVKERVTTQRPSMYKVYLLNDDYTPMEFVIQVLETLFNKNREEATRIMLHVHRRGMGLCGVYTHDVAETKVAQVLAAAQQAQHPLQCTMEKE